MLQLFGCIVIDRYKTQQRSPLDLRPCAEFSGKMYKFLRSLADFPLALVFFCYFIFDSYITCLTLSFHTACVYLGLVKMLLVTFGSKM